MKKIILILNIIIFSCFLLPSHSYAKDLELVVKSAECLEDNKILIKYSVINNRDFDRQNTSILFKIVEDKKPIACQELKTLIPKGEDGSEIHETTIKVPCKERQFNVESTIFQYVKRYRIDEFLKGCPKQE